MTPLVINYLLFVLFLVFFKIVLYDDEHNNHKPTLNLELQVSGEVVLIINNNNNNNNVF